MLKPAEERDASVFDNLEVKKPEPPPTPDYLKIKEAAALIRVHRKTIERAIFLKQLPAFKLGRTWRVSRMGLEEWILRQMETMGK